MPEVGEAAVGPSRAEAQPTAWPGHTAAALGDAEERRPSTSTADAGGEPRRPDPQHAARAQGQAPQGTAAPAADRAHSAPPRPASADPSPGAPSTSGAPAADAHKPSHAGPNLPPGGGVRANAGGAAALGGPTSSLAALKKKMGSVNAAGAVGHAAAGSHDRARQATPIGQGTDLATEDATRALQPDAHRPFASLWDACDRLFPFHTLYEDTPELVDFSDYAMYGRSMSRIPHGVAQPLAPGVAYGPSSTLAATADARGADGKGRRGRGGGPPRKRGRPPKTASVAAAAGGWSGGAPPPASTSQANKSAHDVPFWCKWDEYVRQKVARLDARASAMEARWERNTKAMCLESTIDALQSEVLIRDAYRTMRPPPANQPKPSPPRHAK